jgi:DNA adenine methylase
MPKCSTPFAYYGGKRQLAVRIAQLFPPHLVYCEPFCGAASVFWGKVCPVVTNKDHYREVLNDINHAVVDVFKALRDYGPEVERCIALLPYAQSEYERARLIYQGKLHVEDPVERASLLLLFWCASFSGKATGSLKRAVSSENPAQTWARKSGFVAEWCARLRGVHIEDTDALACIRRWDSPQTLFYVDPPYVGANQGHYAGWGAEDQRRLLEELDSCAGAFVLSGYADGYTTSFAGDRRWDEQRIQVTVRARRDTREAATELLWMRARRVEPTGRAAQVLR